MAPQTFCSGSLRTNEGGSWCKQEFLRCRTDGFGHEEVRAIVCGHRMKVIMMAPNKIVASCMTTLAMAAAFVGCSTDTQADPSIPPDDAIVVVGSGVCEMTSVSDEVVDGVNMIVELFVCEDTMSDPRVSGTEELLVETRLVDSTVGGTWTTREATLTNDGGTWSGTLQGIVDLEGVLPFAEGLVPYNYGEAHFVGEGAYEGLEYHYYISGSNGEAGVTGWITSSD